jgi:SAM-dependent methyltransferase
MHSDDDLLAEMQSLWSDAGRLWDQHEHEAAFEGYVGSDFQAAFDLLRSYRGRATTFLEWGSGLGVVTIMAARLGFEAYGIEIQPGLVELADDLAAEYDADVQFACGSFVPEAFQADLRCGDEFYRTESNACSAYDQLDRELSDFELVYAYPWPDEHQIFRSIMRQCGAPGALLIRYDNREGLSTTRCGKSRRR